MKKLLLCFLAGSVALFVPAHRARGHFVFTLAQMGPNLLLSGSGTLNLSGLIVSSYTPMDSAYANPYLGILIGGPADYNSVPEYEGLLGPTGFGSGGGVNGTSGSGDVVAVAGYEGALSVPQGYVSDAPLSDIATFADTTLSDLGAVPGVYVYTWGSGADADSLTVNIVPEPSTWAALSLGAAAVGLLTLRRRRA